MKNERMSGLTGNLPSFLLLAGVTASEVEFDFSTWALHNFSMCGLHKRQVRHHTDGK